VNTVIRLLRLGGLIDWFLVGLTTEADQLRGKAVVFFSLVLGGTSFGYVPLLFALGQPATALVTAAVVALAFYSPFHLRRTQSVDTSGHLLAGATAALMVTSATWAGGAWGVPLPLLMMVPFAANFIMGRQAALFWTLAGTVAALIITALQTVGGQTFFADYSMDLLIVGGGSVSIFGIWVGYGIATAYSEYRDTLETRLDAAEQVRAMVLEVRDMQSTLDAANAQLGSGDEALTGQMVHGAHAGEEASRRTRSNVAQLVNRIEALDQLLQVLIARVATIEELVKISGRASKRLDYLALNASLEAAHTQEEGFALIASEMGKVAGASSQELVTISEIAAELQQRLMVIGAERDTVMVLGDMARQSATASETEFVRLAELARRVDAASNALRDETTEHLVRVRDMVSKVDV